MIVCNICGQEWEKDPATVVACPVCKAPVGSPCKRPSGHRCAIHVERDQLAFDSGLLPACPGSKPALAGEPVRSLFPLE